MEKYDLIVVGSGAGMNVAWRAINQGMRVALVEHGPVGGTCLNNGCVPSKVLIYPADVVRMLDAASTIGIDGHIDRIDFPRIMRRMRSVVDEGRTHMERGAERMENLDWYRVRGEFVDDYRLRAGDDVITAPRIVIASGSRPLVPPIPGLVEAGYLDNISVLSLEESPESLVIMGGGYIACEYGHFFSAMGTRVTILGRGPRLLNNEDPEISEIVKNRLSKHIDVQTNHEAVKVVLESDKKIVSAVNRSTGEVEKFAAEEIMLAVGRRSNTDLLNPEKTGVEMDRRGWIKVDEYLETTKPGIWSLGDAIGKHMFRHTANYESMVVWANAFTHNKQKVDYHAVPHAVFTHPQVGAVGMNRGRGQGRRISDPGGEGMVYRRGKGLHHGRRGWTGKGDRGQEQRTDTGMPNSRLRGLRSGAAGGLPHERWRPGSHAPGQSTGDTSRPERGSGARLCQPAPTARVGIRSGSEW